MFKSYGGRIQLVNLNWVFAGIFSYWINGIVVSQGVIVKARQIVFRFIWYGLGWNLHLDILRLLVSPWGGGVEKFWSCYYRSSCEEAAQVLVWWHFHFLYLGQGQICNWRALHGLLIVQSKDSIMWKAILKTGCWVHGGVSTVYSLGWIGTGTGGSNAGLYYWTHLVQEVC